MRTVTVTSFRFLSFRLYCLPSFLPSQSLLSVTLFAVTFSFLKPNLVLVSLVPASSSRRLYSFCHLLTLFSLLSFLFSFTFSKYHFLYSHLILLVYCISSLAADLISCPILLSRPSLPVAAMLVGEAERLSGDTVRSSLNSMFIFSSKQYESIKEGIEALVFTQY